MKKNREKTLISTMFTQKELEKLNFTQEEIDAIEEAENLTHLVDLMPSTEKEIEAFFARFDAELGKGDSFEEIYNKFFSFAKTDPKFFNQIIAMNLIIDEVQEVPPAQQQKVSLDDINKEKVIQETAVRKAQFDAIDKALKDIK